MGNNTSIEDEAASNEQIIDSYRKLEDRVDSLESFADYIKDGTRNPKADKEEKETPSLSQLLATLPEKLENLNHRLAELEAGLDYLLFHSQEE